MGCVGSRFCRKVARCRSVQAEASGQRPKRSRLLRHEAARHSIDRALSGDVAAASSADLAQAGLVVAAAEEAAAEAAAVEPPVADAVLPEVRVEAEKALRTVRTRVKSDAQGPTTVLEADEGQFAGGARSPAAALGSAVQPINVFVVGETGDGKSALINGLRDPDMSVEALCGRDPRGVTKDILHYPCEELEGSVPLNLIDTPGVGNHNITPMALIAMMEMFLSADFVPGGIRGIIVTKPVATTRLTLGMQVVQTIVDKGFSATRGCNKYSNIILTGTKADRADEDDLEVFMRGLDGGKSVSQFFFERANPPGEGATEVVHKGDYTPLLRAIAHLPTAAIEFKAPDEKVMATAFAEMLGMKIDDCMAELGHMRSMAALQSGAIKELMANMYEAEQRYREEVGQEVREERLRALQAEAAWNRAQISEVMAKMFEKSPGTDEANTAQAADELAP